VYEEQIVIHGPAIANLLYKREGRDPDIIKRKENIFLIEETGDSKPLKIVRLFRVAMVGKTVLLVLRRLNVTNFNAVNVRFLFCA
jgi:hypothetical protein